MRRRIPGDREAHARGHELALGHGGVIESATRSRVSRSGLRPVESGTELTLVHSGLSNEASARSHEGGWGGALEKLKRQFVADVERPST